MTEQKSKWDWNEIAWRDITKTINILMKEQESHVLSSNMPKELPYVVEFIWREKEIQEAKNIILSGKSYKLSLEWVGGLWKSTLAYELCNRLMLDDKSIKSLWFTAKKEDYTTEIKEYKWNFLDTRSFLEEIIWLMWFYSNDIWNLTIENLKTIFKQLLEKKSRNGKILLVLDNLETVKDQSFFELIKEMIHFQGNFFIIITSRNSLSLHNENNIILEPFSDREMKKIINNFKSHFKLSKLRIDTWILVNYCRWNPLIARILVQKMLYKTSAQLFQDYFNNSSIKENKILNYIYKNTFDSLTEESQIILLVFSNFEIIDEYNLIEIENVLKQLFWDSFTIMSNIEKELSRTFFIINYPSNVSRFWIEKIILSDFVKSFLLENQNHISIDAYSKINIQIQKKDERYIQYKKITEDFWAKSKLESSIISKIIDLSSTYKRRDITYKNFINVLKEEDKLYSDIPYIKLILSKTIRNNAHYDKSFSLNEALLYWEQALDVAREKFKNIDFLKHYIFNLLWLYESLKIYDKKYALAKELLNWWVKELETYVHLVRHELNIWQVEKAFDTSKEAFSMIENNLAKFQKESKFEFESLLISYYQSASAIWEFTVVEKLYNIIKDYWVTYWNGIGHFDLEKDFEKMKKHFEEWGEERLKSFQNIKIHARRFKKWYINKGDFIEFLEQREKIDVDNDRIKFKLYRLTANVNYLYEANTISPENELYLYHICVELSKFWWAKIGEIPKYAEKWIEINNNNIVFYGYMGLYHSKKNELKKAIQYFKKWIGKFYELDENEQMDTNNLKHLKIMKELLKKNEDELTQ